MSELITDKDGLIRSLPYSVSLDSNNEKMARSICGILAKTASDTDKAAIYTQIETLPERLLDVLAFDFKVDWYNYEGSLQEKRKTIRECMFIHRYKGTKFAVETALKSIYSSVRVNEWFEYGGEPFHFSVTINDSTNDEEKRARVLEKIRYYKNLRSVLDNVKFQIAVNTKTVINIGIKSGSVYKRIGGKVKAYGLE